MADGKGVVIHSVFLVLLQAIFKYVLPSTTTVCVSCNCPSHGIVPNIDLHIDW